MTTRLQKNVKQYFKDNIGIIGALLILCIFLSVFPKTSGSFLTQKNIFNVLRQISSNLFLACGMTMVIILGGIDLSVGSIIALSGCFAAGCVSRYGLPIAVGVLGGVLVGTVVGMFNGVVISKTTIPPFIVTLATMNVAKGLAYVYTGGSPVRVVTKEWQFLGAGYVGGVPTPVILLAVVLVITAIIMNKTKLGRHIYAVGGNSQAARFSASAQPRLNSWYIPIQESWRDLRAWFWPPVCIPASRRQETEPRWTPLRLLWWAAPPWQAAPVKSAAPS